MPDAARYRFHPLERRGVLLGLRPAQLTVVGTGVVAALLVLHRASGGAGLLGAAAAVLASVALACWPIFGRSALAWAPLAGRWALHRRTSTWRPDRWLAPAGVTLSAAPAGPGEDPLGVVHDRVSGTWSAVLTVGSGSFMLLDGDVKERRLAAWGAVLASAARAGSPIHRLQWVERTCAADRDELGDYLRSHGADEAGPVAVRDATPAGRRRESYAEVIGLPGAAHRAHEVLVVVSVHPRKASRHLRTFGQGPSAVGSLLRRELRLLQGQLRQAEVHPGRPLDVTELAAAVRIAAEPARGGPRRRAPSNAWPMAVDDQWASVRVDGSWHATYWIAEWPRIEVGADFLTPLLVVAGTRAVALIMAPVPPARAVRQVESARTADLADAELRRRAGFLTTARHGREAEGALRREVELADGHGDYRFCGYVSASAATVVDLEAVCGELEQAAQQSHLALRRLYGQQHEALSWTMPLGRGLS